eukprot:TRINITY_DN47258_c0_g1_i1.p1 TRINITY_DN47258_c0_g1~~TRINITY_DN47258_c0_g1_i1.p1  ORF type:complete len:373 (-),score=68.80 TRINITY_DN47258_c0_g1_i1:240-1358(-)
MAPSCVFSDIDGTIVHYPDKATGALSPWGLLSPDAAMFLPTAVASDEEDREMPVLQLPPSSSGLIGYITHRTLRQVAELRARGVLYVLVSGARTSTVLERLPYLPRADAYVTENGGRIFHHAGRTSASGQELAPNGELLAAPLVEDLRWRDRHNAAAGPSLPWRRPEEREGLLWDFYRKLSSDGWDCDAKGYMTDFRIKLSSSAGKSAEDLREVVEQRPPGLESSFNLGAADFYPATSGKAEASKYLAELYGLSMEDCVSMGDDDNDMELARCVGHTFIPGITHPAVARAVEADPDSFTVADVGGFQGTQDVLRAILEQTPPTSAGVATTVPLSVAAREATVPTGLLGYKMFIIPAIVAVLLVVVRTRRRPR